MVSDMIWSSFSISQITNSSSTVFSIQFFVIEGGVRQKLKFYYFYHHNIDNFNHNRASNANALYFFLLEIRLVPSFYDVKSLCAFLLVQWKNALSPPPLYLPSTTGSKHNIAIPWTNSYFRLVSWGLPLNFYDSYCSGGLRYRSILKTVKIWRKPLTYNSKTKNVIFLL